MRTGSVWVWPDDGSHFHAWILTHESVTDNVGTEHEITTEFPVYRVIPRSFHSRNNAVYFAKRDADMTLGSMAYMIKNCKGGRACPHHQIMRGKGCWCLQCQKEGDSG